MRRISTAGASIVIGIAFGIGACHGNNATSAAPDAEPEAAPSASADETEAGAASASAASASDAAAPGPVVHHRGIAGPFFRAALEADLTDDQKATLDKLEEPIRNDPGARKEASAFRTDLVASIKAGRIEGAKLQADEAAITKAVLAHQEEQATALNGLHAALSAEQRKAVVDAVRASQPAHDHPPTFMLSDAGASEWVAHRLERMKSQLVLDLDQQKEVAAVLARNEPPPPGAMQAHAEAVKKQTEALLVAFEKDAFDAKKLDLSATPGHKPTEALDRQVKYVTQLMPILTAGQRDRLAGQIERPRGKGESIAEPFEMGAGMVR